MWAPYSNKTLAAPVKSNLDFDTSSINKNLQPNKKQRLQSLLSAFPEAFAAPDHNQGCTKVVEHHLRTEDETPVKEPLRRFAFWQRDQIANMLKKG